MKYIYLSIILILSGCFNTIPKLKVDTINNPAHIESVEFEKLDINKDGSVDKKEFDSIKNQDNIEIKKPILTTIVLISSIIGILYIIKIRNKK